MGAQAEPHPGVPVPRGRCRCGHLPTHHMVVRPIAGSGGFRLVPAGPCQVCGEAACRVYSPGAPA